jgi:hypothetical protein
MSDDTGIPRAATPEEAEGEVLAGEETTGMVRARRERLRRELMDLEQVLSGPVTDTDSWTQLALGAAASMHDTLREHVEETEAPEGMLAQVARDAPWLEGRLEQLRGEHARLLDAAEQLEETVRRSASPQQIRDVGLNLIQQVSRHRQLGTDLLYDAYMVDISAAD